MQVMQPVDRSPVSAVRDQKIPRFMPGLPRSRLTPFVPYASAEDFRSSSLTLSSRSNILSRAPDSIDVLDSLQNGRDIVTASASN